MLWMPLMPFDGMLLYGLGDGCHVRVGVTLAFEPRSARRRTQRASISRIGCQGIGWVGGCWMLRFTGWSLVATAAD